MVMLPERRPKKSNIPWEIRLRDEYLVRHHSGDEFRTNIRLGPVPGIPEGSGLSAAQLRSLGVFRRYADALVLKKREAIIYEFALLPEPGDISKLQLYGRLFPMTPEFAEISDYKVRTILVGALDDPVLASIARETGIEVVLFQVSWLDEYLATIEARKRRAPAT
jgi:hypothetical protein